VGGVCVYLDRSALEKVSPTAALCLLNGCLVPAQRLPVPAEQLPAPAQRLTTALEKEPQLLRVMRPETAEGDVMSPGRAKVRNAHLLWSAADPTLPSPLP